MIVRTGSVTTEALCRDRVFGRATKGKTRAGLPSELCLDGEHVLYVQRKIVYPRGFVTHKSEDASHGSTVKQRLKNRWETGADSRGKKKRRDVTAVIYTLERARIDPISCRQKK